jgi:hypothetical protein
MAAQKAEERRKQRNSLSGSLGNVLPKEDPDMSPKLTRKGSKPDFYASPNANQTDVKALITERFGSTKSGILTRFYWRLKIELQ